MNKEKDKSQKEWDFDSLIEEEMKDYHCLTVELFPTEELTYQGKEKSSGQIKTEQMAGQLKETSQE
jgi:hypothetical protein